MADSWNDQQLREFEERLRGIERDTAAHPLRISAGGRGGLSIPEVSVLPAIPGSGSSIVYLTTGEAQAANQHWITHAGKTHWTPLDNTTSLEGLPGTPE